MKLLLLFALTLTGMLTPTSEALARGRKKPACHKEKCCLHYQGAIPRPKSSPEPQARPATGQTVQPEEWSSPGGG